jgi:hypothetical protein
MIRDGLPDGFRPRDATSAADDRKRLQLVVGEVNNGPHSDDIIHHHHDDGGLDLLTRDPGRYWTYFPKLSLIAP